MYQVMRPMVSTSSRHTCSFHEKHPGANFPGCTCSGVWSTREKTFAEMTPEEMEGYLAALKGEKPDGTPLF